MSRPHIQPWLSPEAPPCGLHDCACQATWVLLNPYEVQSGPDEWGALPLCDLDAVAWLDTRDVAGA